MKRMKFIGFSSLLFIAAACGSGSPDYDATGTFETTEVLVSSEATGKLLSLEVEEGTPVKAGGTCRYCSALSEEDTIGS